MLATVTAPSEVPSAGMAAQPGAVIGTVAWVVTVSSPPREAISACNNLLGPTTGAARTVYVSHDYVVLDPTTGAFLIGLSS